MSYMTLSSQEKHLFLTLFILSRASDNTTSQYWGGTNAWAVPHLKFGGGPSPSPPRSPPLVMLIGPSCRNPIYCPIGHQIWAPLGKQDVCPNFALTAAKFLFSNSGNFRAKANPPKPRSCPKRLF